MGGTARDRKLYELRVEAVAWKVELPAGNAVFLDEVSETPHKPHHVAGRRAYPRQNGWVLEDVSILAKDRVAHYQEQLSVENEFENLTGK